MPDTSWREFVKRICTTCEFYPVVAIATIEEIESTLKLTLPDSLRQLLMETNGLYDNYSQHRFIWNAEDIRAINQEMRSNTSRLVVADDYMTFESLLFFGSAGVDGIWFAFPVTVSGKVQDRNIIAWYPIEDSRPVVAHSLQIFIEHWLSGKLHV